MNKKTLENPVTSFFFYMWNSWCEEECRIIFGSIYKHYWNKWCIASRTTAHGAAEKFYAQLTPYNRNLLVERACKIYDGEKLREPLSPDKIYRCEECGSLQVLIQAWVDPTKNFAYTPGAEDFEGSWCKYCEANVRVITHKEFMEKVEDWWKYAITGEDYEVITGLNEADFNQEDDGKQFTHACNALWNAKNDEEKIEIWKTITRREEQE